MDFNGIQTVFIVAIIFRPQVRFFLYTFPRIDAETLEDAILSRSPINEMPTINQSPSNYRVLLSDTIDTIPPNIQRLQFVACYGNNIQQFTLNPSLLGLEVETIHFGEYSFYSCHTVLFQGRFILMQYQ